MNIFIAGIAGTFMSGIAQLAKSLGHQVSGCDENIYPPISTLLESENITCLQGYDWRHLAQGFDQIIIGNALSRGNPLVEYILREGLNYVSGPQWLNQHLLRDKKVIAVTGTHGKTSTSSMISWILHQTGKQPGFLIGGKPGNFSESAQQGNSQWFTIEADEYDTAFFDKRSKFVHYNPYIVILGNLEFDHTDIFDDLNQIKKHFNQLLRIVPDSGKIIANKDDPNILNTVKMGCWTPITYFSVLDRNEHWYAETTNADYSQFQIYHHGHPVARVYSPCIGKYNMQNALAAIISCINVGVTIEDACDALSSFIAPNRRLQLLHQDERVSLYEDFAHHPTAIAKTLEAIKCKRPNSHIVAIVEPWSNTMKSGKLNHLLHSAFKQADSVIIYQSTELPWKIDAFQQSSNVDFVEDKQQLLSKIGNYRKGHTIIVCMSNGSFDGIPEQLSQYFC